MNESKATSITAALGSVIGYLGGEVSQRCLLERLLWPQRYYHHINLLDCVRMSFLLPMGGPIHRAALETLDGFLVHGLYKGIKRGDMLGTAFFPDQTDIIYYNRTARKKEDRQERKKVRNGFWTQVLKHASSKHLAKTQPGQVGCQKQDKTHVSRTTHTIYILDITHSDQSPTSSQKRNTQKISEGKATLKTIFGIALSETSTLAVAVAASVWLRDYWLTGYFCVPLSLRILALIFSVRRETLQLPAHQKSSKVAHPSSGTNNEEGFADVQPNPDRIVDPKTPAVTSLKEESQPKPQTILELIIPNNGFTLLTTPYPLDNTLLQFFRHYGHPIRHTSLDRIRETISITIVWAFVLFFPAGLLASVWMDTKAQFLWLAYETYTVVAMHLMRLAGWNDCGRSEVKIAKELERGNDVLFEGGGVVLRLRLRMEEVESFKVGQDMVDGILEDNRKHMENPQGC